MARTETLEIRLTTDEKTVLRAAAERERRTLGDWARVTLAEAARATEEKERRGKPKK